MNNCLSVHHGTKHDSAYCDLANQWEVRMPLKARNLVLTKSQAACLVALRHRKGRKAGIAILAKLDLLKTAAALRVLMRLGLARQDRTKAWHSTACAKPAVSRQLRMDRGETAVYPALAPGACSKF